MAAKARVSVNIIHVSDKTKVSTQHQFSDGPATKNGALPDSNTCTAWCTWPCIGYPKCLMQRLLIHCMLGLLGSLPNPENSTIDRPWHLTLKTLVTTTAR